MLVLTIISGLSIYLESHKLQLRNHSYPKGPNFALSPSNPPSIELISGIELVCHKLSEQDMQELRAETNCLLRRAKPPKLNITKEEHNALKELRQDKERMVLTADMGVAMVVMDRNEYMEKVEGLLAQPAYRTIAADPTNKLKARLIQTLKRIKRDANMEEGMYKAMYPTGCIPPPSSMDYQKSIKLVPPLGQLYLAGALSLMV